MQAQRGPDPETGVAEVSAPGFEQNIAGFQILRNDARDEREHYVLMHSDSVRETHRWPYLCARKVHRRERAPARHYRALQNGFP